MSLFSTYDWWSTKCEEKLKEAIEVGQGEDVDFHAGSLHVTDLIRNGFHIIIVGNNSGKLWAYKPTSSSSPQDLLFEYNFTKPILAFESGYLLLGSTDKQLAVLHPRQVTIYSIHESFGNAAHGQQFHLQPAYSINFQFVAYSIIIGAFGSRVKSPAAKEGKDKSGIGKNAQDAICVQAMDGSLHFFENDMNVLCVTSKNEHGGLPVKKEKSNKHQFKDGEAKNPARKTHSIRAEIHGYPSEDYLPRNKTLVPSNVGTDNAISVFPPETLTDVAEVDEEFQQLNVEDTVRDEDAVQLIKAKFTFAPLEDTNLPTLLCYLSSENSFVVFSGSWTIDCYRYATLLMQQITSRRKKLSLPEWSYVFGEPIFSLCCLQGNIFALGVRGTLVGLNPFGVQRFCKRLCLSPSALCPYASENKLMLLVASEEGTLLVYDGGPNTSGYADSHFGSLPSPSSSSTPKLIWSAKLPCTPVAMARANFEELSGLVVILTAEGHLQCCHLGTTPKNFTSSPPPRTHIKEHKEIENKLIQPGSKRTTSQSVGASKGNVELSLEFVINNIKLLPKVEGAISIGNDDGHYGEDRVCEWKSCLEVDISLILIPMIPLNNVCLSATLDSPLEATLGKNFIERLYEEIKVPMVVRASYNGSILYDAIPSLVIEVTASCFGGYSGAGEELSLMVFHTYTTLPPSAVFSQKILHAGKENEGINVACESAVDLKAFDFHFQGHTCPTIPVLFPEFLFSQSDASLKSFELYLFGHGDKKVQLVRRCQEESGEEIIKDFAFSVTSFCMLPLYYLACVLAQKLENHAAELGNQISGNTGKQKGVFFHVTPKNSLPIQEFLEAIDAHTEQRKNVAELNKQLGFLINQLHMVECCILSRVKDTTPKPIMFSEILLEQFLEKITCCINSLGLTQQKLHSLTKKLRIILQLVMQLQPEFTTSSVFKTFGNAISLTVRDTINQGWEERSMANLAFAIRGQRKSNLHNFSDGETHSVEAELSTLSTECLKNDIAHFVDNLSSTPKK